MLLPGFSGAPVVDSSRQLIGIVDGGLDKGQSGYNWVIPARHLRDLLASAPTSTSPSTAAGSASLFSYGYVGAVENAIIEYDQRQWHYRWVKTKTKSLADLIRTSNSVDLAEIRSFLREHESVFGSGAEERLQFDIYEDQDKQLIIALPVGQALRLKNPVPGYRWLVSEANDVADGHIQFEQLEWSITPPGGGAPVSARDPDYFDAAIAEILRDCNQPGESRCQQAADSRKDITFPSGEKILKVGFNVFPEAPDGLTSYDFYSFAVRPDHDVAFRAYGRIYPGRDGIFECVDNPHIPECLNSKAAFTQLKQMLAVALISPRVNYRPRPPMNLSIE